MHESGVGWLRFRDTDDQFAAFFLIVECILAEGRVYDRFEIARCISIPAQCACVFNPSLMLPCLLTR